MKKELYCFAGFLGFLLTAVVLQGCQADKQGALHYGFNKVGHMQAHKYQHNSILLKNGKVLILPGLGIQKEGEQIELYNPETRRFNVVSKYAGRIYKPILLPDGNILGYVVSISRKGGGQYLLQASVAIYDTSKHRLKIVGETSQQRDGGFDIALLNNKKTLITGGHDRSHEMMILAKSEEYEPESGLFTPVGNMLQPRTGHFSLTTPDGKVFIAGGDTQVGSDRKPASSVEFYDPQRKKFVLVKGLTGKLEHPVYAAYLDSGDILFIDERNERLAYVLYNPLTRVVSGSFPVTLPFQVWSYTFYSLPANKILILAVDPNKHTQAAKRRAFIFDPLNKTTEVAGETAEFRWEHAGTVLQNGTVLLTGGSEGGEHNISNTAELFVSKEGNQ